VKLIAQFDHSVSKEETGIFEFIQHERTVEKQKHVVQLHMLPISQTIAILAGMLPQQPVFDAEPIFLN
jgi:hypothetical protein